MAVSRRKFIRLAIKSAVLISVGNTLQSFAAGNFVLPAKDKVKLRFAVASDGHYGQPDTKYDDMHNEMISWLNNEKRDRGLEFTMINGDIYHDDVAFLTGAKNAWNRLEMPFYVSHGNHDHHTEKGWEDAWNMPWHYTFEKGDNGFLVLNTADEKGTYICPDIAWTKEALKQYQTKKRLFVFMHITPKKWTKYGIDCPELVKLFDEQENLKAVFHGHDHDEDNVKENNGKHYFFDAHIAGNWGTQYRGYRIIEILKSGEILTYQVNPSLMQHVNNNSIK